MIKIYTDGSCLGNPGPGGSAFAVFSPDQHLPIKVFTHSWNRRTTNNQAELYAIISALAYVKAANITNATIYSDSTYAIGLYKKVVDGTKISKAKPNYNLIERLVKVVSLIAPEKRPDIEWVKAHSTDPHNNYVDEKARMAAEDAKRKGIK